ncbi:MAG: hypothetical protein D4R73_06535 [Deltaproteobacteria bacterium]|nr:MAG: hypothetical protein D4R73_06535 [Deltaproteobacteria bacterium]
MMENKKGKEDILKQLVQKMSIPKAPPPITPVSGLGHAPKTSNPKTIEPQKELTLPITGTELMKRWSIDFATLFHFAREGNLCPYEPDNFKDHVRFDFGFLTAINTDERASYFSQWLYRKSAVEAFENQYGNILDELRKNDQGHTVDPDAFIRGLKVEFCSDTSINLQPKGKKLQNATSKEMQFDRENTKEWLTLIKILKSEDHLHNIGKAHGTASTAVEIDGKVRKVDNKVRCEEYDAKYKILRSISKKFVRFLNEKYKLQLPESFQIFELIKNEHTGTFGPKFIVSELSTEDAHYDSYSKDELIKEIEELSSRKAALEKRGDENSEKNLHQITDKLNAAVILAMKKQFLGQNRAKSYLNPSKD